MQRHNIKGDEAVLKALAGKPASAKKTWRGDTEPEAGMFCQVIRKEPNGPGALMPEVAVFFS